IMAHHYFLPISEYALPPKQTIVPNPSKIGMVAQYPPPSIIHLDSVESTHNLLKTPEYADLPPYVMVMAREQTAGRGQRGNHWESQPGLNLTFSMVVKPFGLHPSKQFSLSEATALAVVALLQSEGIEAKVKWPNDIYVADNKICGILIDHAIDSTGIIRSVVSAGLNINQREFHSDAPNPVSMWQILRRERSVDDIAANLLLLLRQFLPLADTPAGRQLLHQSFMEHLYRNDGAPHPYYDHLLDRPIRAILTDVLPDGTLLLSEIPSSTAEPRPPRPYLFKQVSILLQ
ncbi:MAG: biotin--[acetyl-CoA-carboxylase] ligase, partial [Muribaculaceae bacterium]|nr:biotin--[acetyl-CoA-carboxylase] ligase [Muribaculaceae bacterium]